MRAPGHNDLFLKDSTKFHRRHGRHALIKETKEQFPCPEKSMMVPAAIRFLYLLLAQASGCTFFQIFYPCSFFSGDLWRPLQYLPAATRSPQCTPQR